MKFFTMNGLSIYPKFIIPIQKSPLQETLHFINKLIVKNGDTKFYQKLKGKALLTFIRNNRC